MFIGSSFDIYGKFISKGKGYGVFTREDIPINSIVEICYCIPVSTYEWEDYYYGDSKVLPLGFGCMYNHSDNANVIWKKDEDVEFIINFIAKRDIKVGEEICHNYGPTYWEDRNKKKLI